MPTPTKCPTCNSSDSVQVFRGRDDPKGDITIRYICRRCQRIAAGNGRTSMFANALARKRFLGEYVT